MIPLEGWFTPPDYATASLTVRGPVEQHVIGTSNGVLKLALVECANASLAVFRSCARQFAPPEGVPVTDAFWASITPGSEPAVYGADTSGTLFDRKQCHPWNLNHLGTILDRVRQRIPGVTSPMLYVGAWRAMFGIHKAGGIAPSARARTCTFWPLMQQHALCRKMWTSTPSTTCISAPPRHGTACRALPAHGWSSWLPPRTPTTKYAHEPQCALKRCRSPHPS